MNASTLKCYVQLADPESHFFDRDTMRFFGDSMRNYGVRKATVLDNECRTRLCWELYRKQAVKCGDWRSHYFDRSAYCEVHLAQDVSRTD